MTISIIDSASLYQLLPTLEGGATKSVTQWGWQTSVDVTCLLLSVSSARISPAPLPPRIASGPYGLLTSTLASIVSHRRPSPEHHRTALARTMAWIQMNHSRVRDYLSILHADEANFQPWLRWSVRSAWPEHACRLSGLFDSNLLPQIAEVLGVEKSDLLKVYEASTNPVTVSRWARQRTGADFELARDAYVLSALFRGRYHDAHAQLAERQIMHHPFRRGLLRPTPAASQERFQVSPVENYLAFILLNAAWKERGLHARASRWAANVLLTRRELATLRRSSLEAATAEAAEARAAEIAHRAGVKVEPKWVETALELSVGFGAAALAHFALLGWLIGVAGHEAAHRLKVGRRLSALATPKARLRRLAHAGPGRIQGHWR
jgi:hypothetical protein